MYFMSNENDAPTIVPIADPSVAIETIPAGPVRLDRPPLNAIDVWRFNLENAEASDDRCLSVTECQRRDRFVRAEDRNRFVAARVHLRRLLGAYLAADPASVPLVIGASGKPGLGDATPHPGLNFNLAHSATELVIACSGGAEVGVDIERVDRACDHLGIARHSFHPNEARALEQRGPAARADLFFRWWTAKEAVLKAWGTGLGQGGMSAVDLSAWADGATVEVREAAGRSWSVWHYAIGGCAVALAAEGSLVAIRLRSIISPGGWSGEAITRSS